MNRFVASTLALTLAAGGAIAESHASADMTKSDEMAKTEKSDMAMNDASTTTMDNAKLIRSRDITGGNIYTTNEANDEGSAWDMEYTELADSWNQIGEIEDLVLSPDGKVVGIVAEIGGFLDIGDKHVMIEVADLKLVPVDDQTYAYVTRFNEEQLESMEGVDEAFWN